MKKLSVFFLAAILATLIIVPASASSIDVIYGGEGTYVVYPEEFSVPDVVPDSVIESQSFIVLTTDNPETDDPDDVIDYWFWGFTNVQLTAPNAIRIFNNPSCMYTYLTDSGWTTPTRPPAEGLTIRLTLSSDLSFCVGENTPFVNQTDLSVTRSWIASSAKPSFVSVIGSLFRKLPALLLSAISIFYVGGRLTVLGWLAVPALAIAFAILVIKLVVRFMQFRG